jgi:hypothetical protein
MIDTKPLREAIERIAEGEVMRNKRPVWFVRWRRKYGQAEHGSVTYQTKKRAMDAAREHDLRREYAEVIRSTGERVFKCGNPACWELPPEESR